MCEAPETPGSLLQDLISNKPSHITEWILLRRVLHQSANGSSLVTEQRSVSNGLFQLLPDGACFTACLMLPGSTH